MEPLQESIRNLSANVTNIVGKSNQFKRTFKHANIKCTDAEREDILERAVDYFTNEFKKGLKSLLEETDVAERLDELRELIDSSNEQNQQLEMNEGYRPVNPATDVSGHLDDVQSSYYTALQVMKNNVEEELEDSKADLLDKMETLQELEQKIRRRLKK